VPYLMEESDAYGNTYAEAYHEIGDHIKIDVVKKTCSYQLLVWKDQAAKAADKRPVKRHNFKFSGDDFDTTLGAVDVNAVVAALETHSKAQFPGADITDV